MIKWLIQSVGVGDEMLDHLDHAVLAFQHPVALAVGLVLLIPVGIFVYRRQQRNLGAVPLWVLVALTVTRVSVLVLLVLVLSGPYLKLDYTREKKPLLALLFDHSASMQMPAGPFENDADMLAVARAAGYPAADKKVDAETRKALNRISRIKLAQTAVQTAAASLIQPVAARFDVRCYSFSREVEPMNVDLARISFPEPPAPGGAATHIGDAIGKVLDEAGGSPVAGLLLFSDGQNTGGLSPSEAAHRAERLAVPVFAVACGSTSVLHDVSVIDINTSGEVALGDNAQVTATVESQGLEGKTAKVQLLDGDEVLDSKEVVLRSQEQQQVDLKFEAKRPGPRYLTVNIPPLAEEPEYLRANNADTAFVRVSPEKIRVLYIEGLPRWDFRFLKNAMRRDHGLGGRLSTTPDILLESELRRRPAEQVGAAMPGSVEELARFHTIILGDVSPRLLQAHFVKLLAEAVRERGVGLIVQAGPLYMPHMYGDELQDLLPVQLHPKAAGMEAPVYRPFRIELSPNGAIHEAMRLYDENDRNENIWARMPPYYWCAAAERPSAAATVLAWNPDVGGKHGNLPLIAHQTVGEGKVLFVGTDSTWLWRQNVGDRFFYRFWGQSIRFVARRDQANKPASSLEVWPIRVQPGEPARIELAAFTADGSPRKEDTLAVSVVSGKAVKTIDLAADASKKGNYAGTFTPEAVGEYHISFDPGDATGLVSAKVRVMPAAEESRYPGINRAVLAQLAGASGGRLLSVGDLAVIPGLLKGEAKTMAVHREAAIWDNWLTLVLLVLIYSLDVGLRRLRGLA